jgi:hypothetical protein
MGGERELRSILGSFSRAIPDRNAEIIPRGCRCDIMATPSIHDAPSNSSRKRRKLDPGDILVGL